MLARRWGNYLKMEIWTRDGCSDSPWGWVNLSEYTRVNLSDYYRLLFDMDFALRMFDFEGHDWDRAVPVSMDVVPTCLDLACRYGCFGCPVNSVFDARMPGFGAQMAVFGARTTPDSAPG